ncbi:UDP-N-acetylglucosamine 2-epimerase [Alphaproteobacteria bacterium]|nr:UDP-N-acetylglucosamine 2-epimerase [Alphaproteobacteria bacterium]
MKKKIISVFTGNRAEYGFILPIIKSIKKDKFLDYKLIVSGAHLDEFFGKTIDEINKDQIEVYKQINVLPDKNSESLGVEAIGFGIIEISKVLSILKPDLMLVSADRSETLAATIASTQLGIPTIHVEGGDVTEGGAMDDNIRHAISKLSHLHLTTNLEAEDRLKKMGEETWRIKTIGLPSLDNIKVNNIANSQKLLDQFQLNLDSPILLFTQHSVATEYKEVVGQIIPSLDALEQLAKSGMQIIVTYPNNDIGGVQIIEQIKKLELREIKNIRIYKSLGGQIYHGLLALRTNLNANIICVGNSSSGIKETPFFNCPAVNIGSRQVGRLKAENVLTVNYNKDEIIKAIIYCSSDSKFKMKCKNVSNPYFFGNAGKAAVEFIKEIKINKQLLIKKMTI